MRSMKPEKIRRDLFLAHLTSHLSFHFDELRNYFDSVRQLIREEEKRIADWSESQAEKLTPEEIDDFYNWHSEDYLIFRDLFPNIHRNSIFITIYAELEDILKFICSAIAHEISFDVQVYKWRRGILEEIASCLKNNIGIDFPPDARLWGKIMKIRKIRNTIVHRSSWLDDENKDDKEIIDYIAKEIKYITLSEGGDGNIFYKIQLNDKFIFEVLDTLDNFLKKLITSIYEWSNKVNVGSN